jgi:signal peptidase II
LNLPSSPPRFEGRKYQLLVAGAVILMDRVTKLIVLHRLPVAHEIPVLPGIFQLSHWENTGAAFSMFADSSSPWRTGGLIAFSLVATLVVSILLAKSGDALNATTFSLSLILGGALGNLWDRVTKGTVTDFLDFYIGEHHWPPFNVADSAIVIGSILLLFKIVVAPKRD